MKPEFNAWKVGAPYYGTLLALGAALLIGGWGSAIAWAGGACLAAGLFALYFFRDPARTASANPDDIVSPADGTVVGIESLDETPHFEGPCKRISIFLSIFNVHVNRAPYAGSVRQVLYAKGRYMNAMSAESSKVNESNAVWMDTAAGPMTVRQISGAVARRIVCEPKPGETLEKGVKIGMIKFGSRTELYVPESIEIAVHMKQRVRGGTTIVARRP